MQGTHLAERDAFYVETRVPPAQRLAAFEKHRPIVAGHDEAKAWLRSDAVLLKRGRTQAIPMGYLLTGRIGTGKTFLVECWAGELGIPCVVGVGKATTALAVDRLVPVDGAKGNIHDGRAEPEFEYKGKRYRMDRVLVK